MATIVAGLPVAAWADAPKAQPESQPEGQARLEAAANDRAARRGRLLYAYDQAAWLSTDALFRQTPDHHDLGVAGYVVEPLPDGALRAIYYRLDGATPRAVFTADVRGQTVAASRLLSPEDDAALSPLALRLVAAGAAAKAEALRRKLAPCVGAPFNRVVLPPETPNGPAAVYLLTPQTREGEFPFGGHYEIDVAADGKAAAARAFTRSCLTQSTRKLPDGGRAVELMVTHPMDATPTEIHVWLSLWMGLPVVVSTGPKRIWRVEGDRISLVDDSPAE